MCQLPINNPVSMRLINRLLRAGIKVVEFNARSRRPIIEVDRPFKSWEQGAVEITETRNGVRSLVKMTIWRGAHIVGAK